MTYAVVTGGGTAGHVLPALAVADALRADGVAAADLFYVGCERGIETRLLPDTPYPHEFLDVVGFQRSLSPANLAFAPKMARATRDAIKLLRRLQPKVVVTVGGYASMPAAFAARRLGIPVVVVSYDLRPGRASQLAARFAAASAVAFPDSALPRATVTGAPVRQAILDVDRVTQRDDARRALDIPIDRFFIAVMGGSQGSGVLNEAVTRFLADRIDDRSLAIRHAAGERFIGDAHPPLDGEAGVLYQPIGYESDMPNVYAAADLLIGRGGASTAHEVAVTGTPAILVPWSGAADDHQTLNVRWLANDEAAVMLTEETIEDLPTVIDRLRSSPDELAALSQAAAEKGEIHRRGALAALVRKVADGG